MEMTVVTDPDLEYNKYGVKRASDIQKKGSKIIENRNQQYYFATDRDAQYDESAKRLFGQKSILAHILTKM